MNPLKKSVMLASVAILSWSSVATAFKIALKHLSYFEMILVASITALVIFTAWITITARWKDIARLPLKAWGIYALMGLLNPVCYYLVLFKSYSLLPAQVAQPLNYVWPIALLILLALFQHQPIPKKKYLGMVCSLAGVTLISVGASGGIAGTAISPIGVALALGSAMLWASYWMVSNRYKDMADECVSLFACFLFGTLYLLIGTIFVPVPGLADGTGLLAGAYIGCFEIAIPFICFGMALRITPNPALINQLCYLAPFMSLAVISVVLGESIMPTTYVGLSLIVAGIVYNQYFAEPKPTVQAD